MSRHHIPKPEVEGLIFGGIAGAAIGWAAANQQTQAALSQLQQAQRQPYQLSQKIPLSGSRSDHVDNVLALLKQKNEQLLSQREEFNSKTIPQRNLEIEKFNKPKGFFSRRPKELIPLQPMVPKWKDVAFPSTEEILEGLNANSVWTKDELVRYTDSLIYSIFKNAFQSFHLLPIANVGYFSKQMRPGLERQKLNLLATVKRINEWKRRSNSETKFLFFSRNPHQRIIPNYSIRIPSLEQLAQRLTIEKMYTWFDYHAAQRKIENELFHEFETDKDYIAYNNFYRNNHLP